MKFIISLYIIILLLVSNNYAQRVVSQQEIDSYISNLNNAEFDQLHPIWYFIEHQMFEVLPIIEQNFWQQSCWNQRHFLTAMLHLNSNLTHQYALAFFDSLSKPQNEKYDPNEKYDGYVCGDILRAKVDCIEILYDLGDFSKVDEVFELIEREKAQGFDRIDGISLLPYIYKNRPDYKDQAKQELMQAISTATDDFAIFSYSITLTQAFGEEEIPEMIQIFKNSPSPQAKKAMLEFYFSNYEDKFDLNGLVKETLLTEPNSELRLFLVKILLLGFAQPSDLEFVRNYQQSEPNDTIKTLVQYEINSFQTPPPDSAKSINDLLNYLIDYTDSVSTYNWLADINFENELKSYLTTAKTDLQNGDSLACRVQVKAFQDLVDNVYKDSLNPDASFVTIEGWKFLYWNAQYILNRLPQLPIVINADIDVINPAMSLVNPGAFTMEVKGSGFNSSSVVYFNGNARATTFVSDSVLNAQILSTDVSAVGNYPVWVSDNSLNSDSLIYKVVSALPQPVRPVFECVRNNGDGTYTAYFGYKNDNDVSVYIPIGNRNKFTPNPQDRGQTRVFQPGRKYKVFTVNFNGSNLVWTLNGRTSTASRTSAPCQ